MKCLKCGRETDQTFCQACRKEMERYPVKPGTIVQLPKDRSAAYIRRSTNWRAMVPPEEQIEKQKRTIRRLGSAVAALLVLLVGLGFVIVQLLRHPGQTPLGQNYSTVTKPTEDVTAPTTGPDTELGND